MGLKAGVREGDHPSFRPQACWGEAGFVGRLLFLWPCLAV